MNSVVSDGLRGYTANVDQQGSLQTRVEGTVEVEGSVSTRPLSPVLDVGHRGGSVTTTSSELVPETIGRQALYIANNGSNPACIRFGDDDATADDYRLAPGEKASFPVAPEDAVQAIAIGGATDVYVIELKVE